MTAELLVCLSRSVSLLRISSPFPVVLSTIDERIGQARTSIISTSRRFLLSSYIHR